MYVFFAALCEFFLLSKLSTSDESVDDHWIADCDVTGSYL